MMRLVFKMVSTNTYVLGNRTNFWELVTQYGFFVGGVLQVSGLRNPQNYLLVPELIEHVALSFAVVQGLCIAKKKKKKNSKEMLFCYCLVFARLVG